MELKWLEDFLSISSTRSFSKSAEERHTTQSTLSRRIRSLEDWVGVDLLDRSSYPVTLTPAGGQFRNEAIALVRAAFRARATARSRGVGAQSPIRFSAQPVLARNFFPDWFRKLEALAEVGSVQLRADNLANCIDHLINDRVDFLLCFDNLEVPEFLDRQRFPSLKLGTAVAVPISAPDETGAPRFTLPGTSENPLPYVGFTPDVPVGWHRRRQLQDGEIRAYLEPSFEASMGEVIREFVMDGRGMGWVSRFIVDDDLAKGTLVLAGGEEWFTTNDIRLFRTLGTGSNRIEKIWKTIKSMCQDTEETL